MTFGKPHGGSGQWLPHGTHDSRETQTSLLQRLHCNQFATKPIVFPKWMQGWIYNVTGAWHLATRLGIPETTVFQKCPYKTPSKQSDASSVIINNKVSTVLRAQKSGVLYKTDVVPPHVAHAPKFFMRWTPGVYAVVGSNILVWLVLFNT